MKFQHLLALNLIVLSSASSQTSSGYNYSPQQHNSQGHRHTDFVHSDKHPGYSQPEHFADIQTVKVLHQQAQSATGKHNDYNAYAERHAPSTQDYYVSSNSIGDYNAAGNGYSNHVSSTPYLGISGGYSTGLSNYATDKEHVRVIRVIHEFAPLSSRSQSYGSSGKSKAAKTIKILHEYPRNGYSDSSSTQHKFVKPSSYVPYDHHNAYNSDTNEGAFQDSYETLKSLKAIGIFSKPEYTASNAQYISAPRDSFPPTNTAGVGVGGWIKKK